MQGEVPVVRMQADFQPCLGIVGGRTKDTEMVELEG